MNAEKTADKAAAVDCAEMLKACTPQVALYDLILSLSVSLTVFFSVRAQKKPLSAVIKEVCDG